MTVKRENILYLVYKYMGRYELQHVHYTIS